MNLSTQKRLVAKILKVGKGRVVFDNLKKSEIKEAITKSDLRKLIKNGIIRIKPKTGISRGRIKENKLQKRKGRKKGQGSKKGRKTSRLPRKEAWMKKIRVQRKFLKLLRGKELLSTKDYRKIYSKMKGGFFRSKRHMKLYLEEHNLLENEKIQKTK